MASVSEHYDRVLARHYSSMFGDFDRAVAKQASLMAQAGIAPHEGLRALDLGCGSGVQSIALARMGYDVTAVDQSAELISELQRRTDKPVATRIADIRDPSIYDAQPFDVVLCMGDTLPHLSTQEEVSTLLRRAVESLAPGGRLILSLRDQTTDLHELDRIIPIEQNDELLWTCFLEYEPDRVKVYDLIHERDLSGNWHFVKSYYWKLRLRPHGIERALVDLGCDVTIASAERNLQSMQGLARLLQTTQSRVMWTESRSSVCYADRRNEC